MVRTFRPYETHQLTVFTTSFNMAALSGLQEAISRLLICKNSPNCSMYTFSSSRRRFSFLHLLICDCGCKKAEETYGQSNSQSASNQWSIRSIDIKRSTRIMEDPGDINPSSGLSKKPLNGMNHLISTPLICLGS